MDRDRSQLVVAVAALVVLVEMQTTVVAELDCNLVSPEQQHIMLVAVVAAGLRLADQPHLAVWVAAAQVHGMQKRSKLAPQTQVAAVVARDQMLNQARAEPGARVLLLSDMSMCQHLLLPLVVQRL